MINSNRVPSKQIYMKLFIIMMMLATSLYFMVYGHNVWGGVIAITLLILISLTISNFDLLHPLTWATPFLGLYAISFPVLRQVEQGGNVPLLKETLFLNWIALLVFIIFSLGIKKREFGFNPSILRNFDKLMKPIYVISIVFTMIYLLYVFQSGLSSKYLIKLDSSPLGKLAVFYRMLNVSYFFFVAHAILIKKKLPKFFIGFTLLYTFLTVLIIGERDVFLRIALLTIVLYHVLYKPISKPKLIIIGLVGLMMVPMLANLKNFAVAGEIQDREERGIVLDIMASEFSAASRNLNHLLVNKDSWDYLNGQTFYWDIKKVLGVGPSTVSWFNNKFYPHLVDRGGGNGFSLVGEGYINLGVLGIVFVFMFMALTLRFMYYKSHNSITWLAVYILAIPIVIYTNRADLATYMSQTIKHALIPIVLMFFLKHMLERTSKTKITIKKENNIHRKPA